MTRRAHRNRRAVCVDLLTDARGEQPEVRVHGRHKRLPHLQGEGRFTPAAAWTSGVGPQNGRRLRRRRRNERPAGVLFQG